MSCQESSRLQAEEYFKLKVLWVGVGCQRGVSKIAIGMAVGWVFAEYNLDLDTIGGIATIDLKADEPGLIEYCRESGWFLKIYSPERLNSVKIERPSTIVAKLIQIPSVAEAAALCAAQTDILLVPKQKFNLLSLPCWVSIAIAVKPHN